MIVLIDIIERVLRRIKWNVNEAKSINKSYFSRFLLSHSKDCPNCRAKAQLKSAVPVKVSESFTP